MSSYVIGASPVPNTVAINLVGSVFSITEAEQLAKDILARVVEARESRVERLAEKMYEAYRLANKHRVEPHWCEATSWFLDTWRAAAHAAIEFLEGGEK
jgi:hypothetical protein